MKSIDAKTIYRAYYYDRIKDDKKYVSVDELCDKCKSKLIHHIKEE